MVTLGNKPDSPTRGDCESEKCNLWSCGKVSDSDNAPRLRIRRAGDNKARLFCEDIYSALEFLDKVRVEPPRFAALNLRRIPSIKPQDTDVVKRATSVLDIKEQLREMKGAIDSLSQKTVSSHEPVVACVISKTCCCFSVVEK